MTIHTRFNQEQREFLTNVERAQAAGVTTQTSQAVYHALLGGLSYCNFDSGVAALTPDYLMACEEYLYDRAVEAGQQDNIKWVGIE